MKFRGRKLTAGEKLRPMLTRYLSGRLIPLPHILTIETTSCCNLDCIMCPRTAGFVNTPPNRVITMEIIERLEPILDFVDGVDLSGLWGEAFLHPELYLKILEQLKRKHVGVRTVTNGTLITEGLAERLVSLGLDSLEVSIDAAREETYRKIRRGGKLSRVIKGLEAIDRAKKKRGCRKPRVKLLFLGMTDNIAELPDFLRLARSVGAGAVVLQAMGEYEGVKGSSVALNDRDLGRKWLKEARAEAVRLGVRLELFPPDQFEEEGDKGRAGSGAMEHRQKEGGRVTKNCFFPWDRAVITTGGDVLPCCAAPEPFGNVMQNSFERIWYGKSYRRLRLSLLTGTLPLMCRTCTGQGWKKVSTRANPAAVMVLEKNRLRQRLRRSPLLRKVKRRLFPRSE